MSILNEKMTLNNGVEIPVLGLGTWLIQGEAATQAVKDAIALGYRHIDSAEAYENEVEVGRGIRESGIPREEIFLTTKLKAKVKNYEGAKAAIEESLAKLDVGYIDLMIIHCPQPWNEYNVSENRYKEGNIEAWRALEEAYKAGKIKAIGVSNFNEEDIQNIIDNCEIKPMVNQILVHIGHTPTSVIEYCKENDIVVESYSPIAHGAALSSEGIKEMADKYGVSIAQLCVRYTLQLGTVSLPKTTNPEHMQNDADVEFEISDEDMKMLMAVEGMDYGDSSSFPVFGGRK